MVALSFLEVFKIRLAVHMPKMCDRNFFLVGWNDNERNFAPWGPASSLHID